MIYTDDIKMNRLKFLILIVLMMINRSIYAQNNLEIIEYYEAVKIVSSHTYNVPETPVIVIIDKGVNLEHEDLIHSFWTNKQEISGNGIDDDNNGFIDDIHGWNFQNNTNDISIGGVGNWHGTPVNGIIGAENDNNFGINGISPTVKLMNIVKGESVESIINSLQYVYMMRKAYNQTKGQTGAYIVAVNCSWGKDSLWASNYPEWCSMYDSLGSVGVLSIHSVPNENVDIDVYGDMPSTCESNYVITVSNTNQYDEKVYDAGFGSNSVDLAAPGDNTYTVLNAGDYGYFSGTSAAAPHVTGAIALMYLLPSEGFQHYIQQNPSQTAFIIKSAIMNGVTPVALLENITVSGGRLNVFAGMKLLCEYFGEQHLYQNLFEPIQSIAVYPNPARTHTSLQIECNKDLHISIRIADLQGKNVSVQTVSIQEGINFVPIDLSCLNPGVYMLQAYSLDTTNKDIKLIIQ